MQNQNTNPFEPVSPEQNMANMPELGQTPSSKKSGKIIAMIVAILAIAGSASGYFIYTLRNSAELPPSLEAVTGTGFIAGARDIGFSYETADANLINSKIGATTQRSKSDEYFYSERDMSVYDVVMNLKADNFNTFKAQVIHYNTQDNLFYLFPGGVFKGAPGTSELKLKDTGDKYKELKDYTIPAFSPFIVFTNGDFKTFNTTAGTGTTKTFQIKSVMEAPSTYDYKINDKEPGWHLSVLTKAKASEAKEACANGIDGVWIYNPSEDDPSKMFGTSAVSPSSISSTPTSYLMWVNKKVARGACRVASTQNTNGNQNQQNQSQSGAQQSPPRVVKVTSDKENGSYRAGVDVPIKVEFDKDVAVSGTTKPKLILKTQDTGSTALTYEVEYTSGTGSKYLIFNYRVLAGHNTSDLNYSSPSALSLNGATIKDETVSTLDAILELPALSDPNSLAGQKAIVIDTTPPTGKPTLEVSFNPEKTEFTLEGTYTEGNWVRGALSLNVNGSQIRRSQSKPAVPQKNYSISFKIEDFEEIEGEQIDPDSISEIKATVDVIDLAGNASEAVEEIISISEVSEEERLRIDMYGYYLDEAKKYDIEILVTDKTDEIFEAFEAIYGDIPDEDGKFCIEGGRGIQEELLNYEVLVGTDFEFVERPDCEFNRVSNQITEAMREAIEKYGYYLDVSKTYDIEILKDDKEIPIYNAFRSIYGDVPAADGKYCIDGDEGLQEELTAYDIKVGEDFNFIERPSCTPNRINCIFNVDPKESYTIEVWKDGLNNKDYFSFKDFSNPIDPKYFNVTDSLIQACTSGENDVENETWWFDYFCKENEIKCCFVEEADFCKDIETNTPSNGTITSPKNLPDKNTILDNIR
ncbi:MAG: hypothetical protein RBS56_04115 [Candidatus Gracilibacteria bacterium]|jgi:hypothetical protein|nr:hypothetical protein [Candidatus Gracilibacteria bacterium]